MRILVIIIALCGMASSAIAGPWPRGKGKTFLSFGTTVNTPIEAIGADVQTSYSLYLERGLERDLTFGFDVSGQSIDSFSAMSFLRLPVLQDSDPHRFSLQFGAGMQKSGGSDALILHSGASWGRGFETQFGSAWATIDTQLNYIVSTQQRIAKADVTLGVKPNDRLKLMLQVQAGDYPGSDPYARLAPSLAWEIRPGAHIELGAQVGFINDDRLGARLGTWLEF